MFACVLSVDCPCTFKIIGGMKTNIHHQVQQALYEGIEPESGINIMDFGPVYQIGVLNEKDVTIVMTLTTPGCPLHDSITSRGEEAVGKVSGVKSVAGQITWQSAWSPEKMSMKAREFLMQ